MFKKLLLIFVISLFLLLFVLSNTYSKVKIDNKSKDDLTIIIKHYENLFKWIVKSNSSKQVFFNPDRDSELSFIVLDKNNNILSENWLWYISPNSNIYFYLDILSRDNIKIDTKY